MRIRVSNQRTRETRGEIRDKAQRKRYPPAPGQRGHPIGIECEPNESTDCGPYEPRNDAAQVSYAAHGLSATNATPSSTRTTGSKPNPGE
jgi:hypothetical protein